MKKIAIISIILLPAGMAPALAQAGSCNCPAGSSCGPSECLNNCTASCAESDSGSSCAGGCPIGNCKSAPQGRGGCVINSCCGAGEI